MSRRILTTAVAFAAALLPAAFAGAAAAAGVESHRVDLRWSADEQDIFPSQPVITDTFDSTGPPFGPQPAETRTSRDQMFENTKRGEWLLFVRKSDVHKDPGICSGTFEITKNYVETTATSQTVTYDGEMRLDRCRRTNKFRRAQPGRLGKVAGRSVCTVGSCSGGLEIKGRIRY